MIWVPSDRIFDRNYFLAGWWPLRAGPYLPKYQPWKGFSVCQSILCLTCNCFPTGYGGTVVDHPDYSTLVTATAEFHRQEEEFRADYDRNFPNSVAFNELWRRSCLLFLLPSALERSTKEDNRRSLNLFSPAWFDDFFSPIRHVSPIAVSTISDSLLIRTRAALTYAMHLAPHPPRIRLIATRR